MHLIWQFQVISNVPVEQLVHVVIVRVLSAGRHRRGLGTVLGDTLGDVTSVVLDVDRGTVPRAGHGAGRGTAVAKQRPRLVS